MAAKHKNMKPVKPNPSSGIQSILLAAVIGSAILGIVIVLVALIFMLTL